VGALIDSSVLIAAERGLLDLDRLLSEHGDNDLAVSAITAAELLHGVHRADTEVRRGRREAYVEALLAGLPVIPFDFAAARMHARLSARARSQGSILGAHDLIIAATALAKDLAVVTRDEKSFPRITELELVRW
jgi:predicted nucleic acid-binding protein